MTRTLTFGPCKHDDGTLTGECKRFTLFVNLFLLGGNILHFNPQTGPISRSPTDRKMEAKIVKAYKAISDELPDGTRSLKLEGGTISLDQPQFVLLERYLAAGPAGTQESDAVQDLIEWVSAAEKSEG